VERFLRLTPQKANNFGRAGSYGSWFNFYLCSAGVSLNFGGQPLSSIPGVGLLGLPSEISLPPEALGAGYRCNG
jgi:phospholipid/cholesterol/gamma-HCH transport system substrate-binding protein